MIVIYLQNKLDRYELFKKMKEQLHSFIKNGVVELSLASDRLVINVDESFDFTETIKPIISHVLKKHVIQTKEEIWLLDVISNIFFYEDKEEQLQILSIAKSILSGERQDLPQVSKLYSTEEIIFNAFLQFLMRDSKFCYESFLTFRLRGYFDKLIDCVEMAIDEYQLEHEYQSLVESLRIYIETQTPKIPTVHLVVEEKVNFFDETYDQISEEQLDRMLDKDIIFESEIPINEMIISPLVSIAPKKIHIYSDEFDNGVIQTIQNIFQERVTLHRKKMFDRKNSGL